jgi:hypothetical protein
LLTVCAFELVAKPANPIVITVNNKIDVIIFIIYITDKIFQAI